MLLQMCLNLIDVRLPVGIATYTLATIFDNFYTMVAGSILGSAFEIGMTFKIITSLISLAMVLAAGTTSAQDALPKIGVCPSGYYSSANYCMPSNARARPALPKSGACPTGYYQSGSYCLANSSSPRPTIMKRGGTCPSGYFSSGDYCVKS